MVFSLGTKTLITPRMETYLKERLDPFCLYKELRNFLENNSFQWMNYVDSSVFQG